MLLGLYIGAEMQMWMPAFVALFGSLILEFHTGISALSHRVERLEEQRGLVRP